MEVGAEVGSKRQHTVELGSIGSTKTGGEWEKGG